MRSELAAEVLDADCWGGPVQRAIPCTLNATGGLAGIVLLTNSCFYVLQEEGEDASVVLEDFIESIQRCDISSSLDSLGDAPAAAEHGEPCLQVVLTTIDEVVKFFVRGTVPADELRSYFFMDPVGIRPGVIHSPSPPGVTAAAAASTSPERVSRDDRSAMPRLSTSSKRGVEDSPVQGTLVDLDDDALAGALSPPAPPLFRSMAHSANEPPYLPSVRTAAPSPLRASTSVLGLMHQVPGSPKGSLAAPSSFVSVASESVPGNAGLLSLPRSALDDAQQQIRELQGRLDACEANATATQKEREAERGELEQLLNSAIHTRRVEGVVAAEADARRVLVDDFVGTSASVVAAFAFEWREALREEANRTVQEIKRIHTTTLSLEDVLPDGELCAGKQDGGSEVPRNEAVRILLETTEQATRAQLDAFLTTRQLGARRRRQQLELEMGLRDMRAELSQQQRVEATLREEVAAANARASDLDASCGAMAAKLHDLQTRERTVVERARRREEELLEQLRGTNPQTGGQPNNGKTGTFGTGGKRRDTAGGPSKFTF